MLKACKDQDSLFLTQIYRLVEVVVDQMEVVVHVVLVVGAVNKWLLLLQDLA